MKDYYSPAEASQLTGASKPALRTYTGTYERWFSTEATPEKGGSRRFTAADLKLVAFIREWTVTQNKSHAQTEQALQAGELDQFDWHLPEPDQPEEYQSASESVTSALVPIERMQVIDVLRQSAEQREAEAVEKLEQAQEQIRELERELGQAKGELAGVRSSQYRAPKWWRAIFGGEDKA